MATKPSTATAALRTQKLQLELIFNSARDMMLLAEVDATDLIRVVTVNRPYLETVRAAGYALSAQDFEGRSFADVQAQFGFDAETVGRMRERYEQVIRSGQLLEFEEVTRAPTGVFHGRTTLTPILDAAGACTHVLYSSQDVTAWKQAEQERARSEQMLRAILDHSFQFIGLLDPAGRLLRANQTSLDAVGVRQEQVVGNYFWDTPWWSHDPAEQARLRAAIGRAARGEFVRYETTHPAADGRLLTMDFSLKPVRDEQGAVVAIIPEGRDITESRRAEQALRESEEKFARIFRASPDAMSVHELDTGRYVDVNEGFLRLFDCRRETVIGRTPLELGLWSESLERQGFVEQLRVEGSVRGHPVIIGMKGGRQRRCELSAERIEIDGRPHNVSVLRDITDRLAAEQALRESEEKFAKAFRSSPQPLIISEIATGRYIDVNLGFERVSGYSRADVIGRSSLETGIWENLADRQALFARLQEEGRVRDMELNFRRKDGGRLVTRCSFETIELAGVRCMLSTITDITEQRQAETQKASLEAQLQQNQKLEALGTLAGGIAHDFNNILTAIIINQELALMDLDQPADLRRRLDEIGLASNRAKELVRQILTFSRQQQHERLRQPLQMIIREALGLLRASLPATIEISQDMAPDAPPVLADAGQVHQVVMNLCTNAAHAMRDRPGRLTVRLALCRLEPADCVPRPGLQPGPHARLTIADTGHGMDATVLARIFEPFFTTKGPGEGTGLGLPMVHGIMKSHDGAIFVQSQPGEGTTFELYFPAAPATDSAVREPVAGLVPGQGESVLLVDDEEAIGQAVGAMLRRIGYHVEIYEDPREALACVQARPGQFSLLLTDRTMPHLSGPELIQLARTVRPDLPVLLMSGMSGSNPPDGAEAEAGYGLVEKPIDIAELSRTVRRALDLTPHP
ncbi:Blue-light-activated protein [Lacunisphaera limnophila]|uniref:histidine kinase n=1 Tax=Lacunisphaera limnophila TaxID=1838286 RepID=A0A1D8AR48_9BACT|nr:PAS domain S-box protein [Lacunisphaera limnophila]AOS43352.1 Blue-light-activated protein [Lacunisphaera limnophila]